MKSLDKVNNPHDKLFKETFGDLDVTKDFVKNYLPEEILGIIELQTLTALKDSFIEEELKDGYSDLLFRVDVDGAQAYLYFLFEHKSYQQKDIAFQMLGNIQSIWHQELKKEKAKEIPLIVPIVFYHGKRRWSHVKTIADWTRNMLMFQRQSNVMYLILR